MSYEGAIERASNSRRLGGCERPSVIASSRTGEVKRIPCRDRRETECQACAQRYRRRFYARTMKGLVEGERISMLTLTAPGMCDAECGGAVGESPPAAGPDFGGAVRVATTASGRGGLERANDRAARGHSARCRERCFIWNRKFGARWHHFMVVLRDKFPGVEFIKVAEAQERGALHAHALIRGLPYVPVEWWRRLAVRCGWGRVVWIEEARAHGAAAGYLVKYVSKEMGAEGFWPRPWSSSRRWSPSFKPWVREPAADGPWVYVRRESGQRVKGGEAGAEREPLMRGSDPRP